MGISQSPSHIAAGSELAGYRIEGVAGQGGMGVVYRATQLGLDRPVALKVIATEFATSADFRERFKAEAQLAASIDHPNVVPVYEAGEADGLLYLVMRYVEGTDLREVVEREDGLAPERAVRLVWQVASALDAAHRRGLVHRDVKPPNVLVAEEAEDHAYLTDFGLTKHAAAAGGITRTGQFVGTPDFVAPEQIRGETADARADVYALACVLFHALTGRVPFPRPSELAKMYAHLSDEPPSVAALVPGVATALDGVIATGMAKDPADRYASAGDLARAAWAALQGQPAPRPAGSVATGQAATAAGATSAAGATVVPPPAGSASTPPPGAAGSVSAPKRSKGPAGWPRRRRVALLVALPTLLLAAVAVAALAAAGVLGGDDGAPAGAAVAAAQTTPAPNATPTPPPASTAANAPPPRTVATIGVGDGPDGVAVDRGSVFVSNSRDATLTRIDARTSSTVGGPVAVGQNPDQIAAGKGVVWVADNDTNLLSRLQTDPELLPTATVQVGQGSEGVSLGPQLVWVANTENDTVSRVDRAQAQTVGDPIGVGTAPTGIFVGSKVWVTNFADDTVSRIDIATAQVEGEPIPVGAGPRGVTEGLGGVWVSNTRDGTVSRIDPRTNEAVATIGVGRKPKDIVAAHGFVWVANSGSNTVSRIDPTTNRLVGANLPVGRTPVGIAASRNAVWVTNFGDDTVTRIDPDPES
jgi:YVTN family beta-propeller protein